VIPKFFGEGVRQLFGVYHPPEGRAREAGVLLCNPGPQEYRHTHWGFRKLAGMIAKEGFHVLRFDYFATGDSAGDGTEGSIDQWILDISTASHALRDTASVSQISVVGMRLGAALAARACAAGLALEDLVLWEPIVSGRAYVAQLESAQATYLSLIRPPQDNKREPHELLGYPMSPAMRDAVSNIDLLEERVGAPGRVLLVSGHDDPIDGALADRYTRSGTTVTRRVVEDFMLYPGGVPGFILVAHNIPVAIASWLARKTP
jgi:pimeloyl-ACP methyl ester carboxylesterase